MQLSSRQSCRGIREAMLNLGPQLCDAQALLHALQECRARTFAVQKRTVKQVVQDRSRQCLRHCEDHADALA